MKLGKQSPEHIAKRIKRGEGIVDEKAELPVIPNYNLSYLRSSFQVAKEIQQDMLKAGYRKII
jgi:hypothetical protein